MKKDFFFFVACDKTCKARIPPETTFALATQSKESMNKIKSTWPTRINQRDYN